MARYAMLFGNGSEIREEDMEGDRDRVISFAQLSGATEEEAWVLEHLALAAAAWQQVPDRSEHEITRFSHHLQTLFDLITARITRREHPEAWGGGS